jgi:hypothetical protein
MKGIIEMLKRKKNAADKAGIKMGVGAVAPAPSAPEPVERTILRDTAKALDAARQKLADRENEIARLQGMIEEGAKSEARLADLIGGEVGPDDALMQSSVALEISARAAAKRLPHAKAALEDDRRVAMQAETQRNIAAHNVLKLAAGKQVAEYREHWRALTKLYDEILGIAAALPPLDRMESPIADSMAVFSVPSPSIGTTGSYSPTMSHLPAADWAVSARWGAAREALLDDPEVDFASIINDATIAAPTLSHLPPGMTENLRDATHVDAGKPVGPFGLPFSSFAP